MNNSRRSSNTNLYVIFHINKSLWMRPRVIGWVLKLIVERTVDSLGLKRGRVSIDISQTSCDPRHYNVIADFAIVVTNDEMERLVGALMPVLQGLVDNSDNVLLSLVQRREEIAEPYFMTRQQLVDFTLTAYAEIEKMTEPQAQDSNNQPPDPETPKS